MIYLIITTSINNNYGVINYEHRKKQYINCISSSLKLIENNNKIKPIIVENNGITDTYLNELKCDIVYTTNNNNNKLKHKGVNELLDIQFVINKYNIQDNDYIIKLTGRYKILNDYFFNLIINNIDKYDAFIKFFNVCTKKFMYDDCVLGLFSIKCKYLKDFNYKCKLSPECEFAIFVRNNIENNKIMEIDNLNLECCFADDLRILNV